MKVMHLPRNTILGSWLASRDERRPILPHCFEESQIFGICILWRAEKCLQLSMVE